MSGEKRAGGGARRECKGTGGVNVNVKAAFLKQNHGEYPSPFEQIKSNVFSFSNIKDF